MDTENKHKLAGASAGAEADQSTDDGHQPPAGERGAYKQIGRRVLSGLRTWTYWERASVIGEVLFAAAVAWWAWVQADVSNGQLEAMKAQNIEISRQGKTAQVTARAAKDAIELSREQMQLEQRAWLSFETAKLPPLALGEPVAVTVTIKNTGQTPATIYRWTYAVVTAVDDADRDAKIEKFKAAGDNGLSPRIVSPQGSIIMFPTYPAPQQEDRDMIETKATTTLYFMARISYRDAFGIAHRTWGCFRHKPKEDNLYNEGDYQGMD